jgi:hypothetical protein
MPQRTIHLDWRNEQEASRYPFADNASLQSDAGLDIGAATFLDASLYPIGNTGSLHISAIVCERDRITIYIGTLESPQLCSAVFDPTTTADTLAVRDIYDRPAGVLVSAAVRLAHFAAWPLGTQLFDAAATAFAASVCIPTPEIGVRGFVTDTGDIVAGDVLLVGDQGIVLTHDLTENIPDTAVIRVDCVGDPLSRRAVCNRTVDGVPLFTTKSYLRTINFYHGHRGDFQFVVGRKATAHPVLRVVPTDNGLHFEVVGRLKDTDASRKL